MRHRFILLYILVFGVTHVFSQEPDYKLKVYIEPYKSLVNSIIYSSSDTWGTAELVLDEPFPFLNKIVYKCSLIEGNIIFEFLDNSFYAFNTNLTSCKDIEYNSDSNNVGEFDSKSNLSYEFIENNGNKILVVQADSVGIYNELEQQSGQYYSSQTWIYESGQVQVKVGKSYIKDQVIKLGVLNGIIRYTAQGLRQQSNFFLWSSAVSNDSVRYDIIKYASVADESKLYLKYFPKANTVFEYYLDSTLAQLDSINNPKDLTSPLIIQTLVTDNLRVTNASETYNYLLFSVNGQKLEEGSLDSDIISTSFLSAGSYIIQFRNEKGETQAFKFVKL